MNGAHDWRPSCLRLGLTPVLALMLASWLGRPLPFLVPIFVVILLMLSPVRLPVSALVKMVLLVACCSGFVSLIARVVGNNPVAFWLCMAALVVMAFARLKRQPGDLPGLLILIVSAISMVLVQFQPELVMAVPPLMVGAFVGAYLWSVVAFVIWPQPSPYIAAAAIGPGNYRPGVVVFKSLAMLTALVVAIWLEDSSAVLIGATIANLLRSSDPDLNREGSLQLLRANLLGAVAVLPVILLASLNSQPVILLLLALAGNLWLAGRLAMGMPAPVVQTALTVYVALLGSALPRLEQGVQLVGDRLLTLLVTVLYCALVMRLLFPPRKPMAQRPSNE